MIFLAQALPMNGGSTFLLRLTEALAERDERCLVILLRRDFDDVLLTKLRKHAEVVFLVDYLVPLIKGAFPRHFGIFAPVSWRKLVAALHPFGKRVHVMGVFGLLFGKRLARHAPVSLSAGVYHQNEFAFVGSSIFERRSRAAFRALPSNVIIFFNESVRTAYARFFARRDLANAPLAPIGIIMPDPLPRHSGNGTRIVSVGNLERFKTYNAHVIGCLPAIARDLPSISYHIYGRGPEEVRLRQLTVDLGLVDRVHFHGVLDYAAFAAAVGVGDVFVGSGTAVLEAAALGRPAIIGVESIATPETYGFLSAIPDLSYNEAGLTRPLRPIEDCLRQVLFDADDWVAVARSDRTKAGQFSIQHTAACFMMLPDTPVAQAQRSFANHVAMGVSLAWLAALKAARISDAFGLRRNQSL